MRPSAGGVLHSRLARRLFSCFGSAGNAPPRFFFTVLLLLPLTICKGRSAKRFRHRSGGVVPQDWPTAEANIRKALEDATAVSLTETVSAGLW